MKVTIEKLEIEGSETLLLAFAEWLKASTPMAKDAVSPKKDDAERLILSVYGSLNPENWQMPNWKNGDTWARFTRLFDSAADVIDLLNPPLSTAQREYEANRLLDTLNRGKWHEHPVIFAPTAFAAQAMLSWAYPDQGVRFGVTFLPDGDPPPCPFASAPLLVYAALGEDNFSLSDQLERDLLSVGLRFATPSVFVGNDTGETVATSKGYAEYVDSLMESPGVVRLSDIELEKGRVRARIQRAARSGFYWGLVYKSQEDLGPYFGRVQAWAKEMNRSFLGIGWELIRAFGIHPDSTDFVDVEDFLNHLESGCLSYGLSPSVKEGILSLGIRQSLLLVGSKELAERLRPSLEAALSGNPVGETVTVLSSGSWEFGSAVAKFNYSSDSWE